ncbi:MAG: DUF1736 domain-containing protein [Candidatus Tenebribacter davisii]|nr:DUF1736 domain-containing protein [Candidatus Tenebribacter davisii]
MSSSKKQTQQQKRTSKHHYHPKRGSAIKHPKTDKKFLFISYAIIAILPAILYFQTIHFDFAYDDDAVLRRNRIVKLGTKGISEILKTQYFKGYATGYNAMAYRPVPLIITAVQYEMSGLNPGPYHAANIFFYLLTGIFLFAALRKLLYKYPLYLPLIITILYLIHPIHVEVVANIKNRDEILGFLCFVISLLLLLVYLDKKKYYLILLSMFFYFLSLLSKEMMITTLAVIPLITYFFRDYKLKKIAKITIPFIIIFVIYMIIRLSVIGSDHGASPITYLNNPLLAAQNTGERIGTNLVSLGMYIKSLIFPNKLVCDYSYNSIPLVGVLYPQAIISLLAYIVLIIIAVRGVKRKDPFSFAILFFLITISIVSNVFVMSSNAYADRLLYLPSLSICFVIAFLLYTWIKKRSGENKYQGWQVLKKNVIVFAVILVVGGLAVYRVYAYLPVWNNNLTLFMYCSSQLPENARLRKHYGGELSRLAVAENEDKEKQEKLVRMAIKELNAGLSIYPKQAVGHIHLGNCYIMLNLLDSAEMALYKALTINPNSHFAKSSLGNVLYRQRKYAESAKVWETMDPRGLTKTDYYNFYLVYNRLGDSTKANYYRRLSGK